MWTNNEKEIIRNRIKSIKRDGILYRLDMITIIQESVIRRFGIPISKKEIDNFNNIIDVLKTKSNMSIDYIDKRLNRALQKGISKEFIIFVDGLWSFLNKLDTNVAALEEFLMDLFDMIFNDKTNPFNLDMRMIINEMVNISILSGYNLIEKHIKEMIKKYFPTIKDFKKYENIIIKTSIIGDNAENETIKYVEPLGYKLLYKSHNGCRIDMKFLIDLIFYDEEIDRVITVQVKNGYPGEDYIKRSFKDYNLDVICYLVNGKVYPITNPRLQYDIKSKIECFV